MTFTKEIERLERHCHRRTFDAYFLYAALPGNCPLYRLAVRTCCLCFLIGASIVQGAKMFVGTIEMRVITDSMPPTVTTIYVLMQVVIASVNGRAHEKLVRIMSDDLREARSDEENVIKRKFLANTRTFLLLYTITVSLAWFVVFVSELLPDIFNVIMPLNESRPHKLLFQAVYPIDEQEYYFLILVLQDMGVSVVLFALVTNQNLLTLSVQHLCYMFALIGHRLENISRVDSGTVLSEIEYERIVTRRLKVCIDGHRKALEFALLIQSYTDVTLALFLLIIVLSFSISLVEATDLELLSVRTACFTVGQLGQFLLLSVLGQKQIDESTDMIRRVYNAEWYNCPVHVQKLFLLMTVRCSKPCEQVVKKLYTLSLRNFVSVIHTCISFYMVLREF